MTSPRLPDYLLHMQEAARQALSFVGGMSEEAFKADIRTQRAVILEIVVIGEASTRLLKEHAGFAGRHPEVPWTDMKGMRNRIAHGYFEIDLGLVWSSVTVHLPELVARLPGIQGDAEAYLLDPDPARSP
jgi:uncharacterized protein with HEPN domain